MSDKLNFRHPLTRSGAWLPVRARYPKRVRRAYQTRRQTRAKGRSYQYGVGSPRVTSMVNRAGAICAPRYFTKMSFRETWVDTDANGFVAWNFFGNGMWDPDTAGGGGHTPGMASLGYLYKFYRVYGSSVQVNIVNNDTDDPLHVAVMPNIDGANILAAAQQDNIQGLPSCKSMIVLNQTGQGQLYNSAKTKTLFGIKDIDDAGFGAAYNADPTHNWYWTLYLFNKSANALNCEVSITITFNAEWYGPNFVTLNL